MNDPHRRGLRAMLVGPALLAAAACAAPPPITLYAPPIPPAGEAAPEAAVPIAVEPLRVAPAYDSPQITYRTGAAVYGRYGAREWASDPGWLFAALTADRLEAHFREVRYPDAPAPAEIAVGGLIRVLVLDHRPEDEVTARLAIEYEIRDLTGVRPPRTLRATATGTGPDIDAAIARLGPAFAAEVDRLAAAIRAELAARASAR